MTTDNIVKNAHGYPWMEAVAPNIDEPNGRKTGLLRSCSYCGSMHPSDVVVAIQAGAVGHWVDFKYGWPHKMYFDKVPNPHAGMKEIRASSSTPYADWEERRSPRYSKLTGERVEDYVEYVKYSIAGPTTYGKFYTKHLQDATPEERDIIEKHMGHHFEFTDDGKVRWWPYGQPKPTVEGV